MGNKYIVNVILMIFLFSLIINCEKKEILDNPWESVIDIKVKQPVRMAAFLNESFGLTGGFSGAGKANRTLDGGKTWTMADSSGGCLYGIEIVDRNTVWVAGKMHGLSFTTPGGLRLSKDGGVTFEPQADITTQAGECPMSFFDQNNGWFYQDETLQCTADGGRSWKELALPADAAVIKAVQLRTKDEGYLLDTSGTLFTTNDSGKTWSKTQLPLQKYHLRGLKGFESVAAGIRFSDKYNGIIAASFSAGEQKDRVQVFRTKDGGQHWQSELVGYGNGAIFISPDARFITIQNTGNIRVFRYTGKE